MFRVACLSSQESDKTQEGNTFSYFSNWDGFWKLDFLSPVCGFGNEPQKNKYLPYSSKELAIIITATFTSTKA